MTADQPTLPFQPHSATSRAAAERMRPKAGIWKAKILDRFEFEDTMYHDGLTDEEGINRLHMNPSTYRPRRIELVRDGWIEDSGTIRPTRGGGKAVVWRLKQ